MSDEYRPNIKNALDAKNSQSSLSFQYDTEKLKQENRYKVDGQAFPEKINKFNWGACIIPPIWGLFNNSPIACLILLIGFIRYVGWLLAMIFSIYCGIKGNEWAWTNKEWVDLKQFHQVQRNWAIGSVIFEFIVIIVMTIAILNTIDKYMQTL